MVRIGQSGSGSAKGERQRLMQTLITRRTVLAAVTGIGIGSTVGTVGSRWAFNTVMDAFDGPERTDAQRAAGERAAAVSQAEVD